MLNILASITIAENEKGELGVGLDLQLNEETLKKVQELLPQLAEDVSKMTVADISDTIKDKYSNNFTLEQEIKDKVDDIDVNDYMDQLRENIFGGLGVPREYLEVSTSEDVTKMYNRIFGVASTTTVEQTEGGKTNE